MPLTKSFHEYLIQSLKDPVEAAAYLEVAIEDGDLDFLLVAIRDVVEAQGGMSRLAKKSKLNRGNLYKMLSKKGNPNIFNVDSVLKALGLRLAVVADQKTGLKKAA
jgi:probable addiction module antidote protein